MTDPKLSYLHDWMREIGPVKDLARLVAEACKQETLSGLARRLGLPKNYIFRAAHPGQKAPCGREYNPPLKEQAETLLKGLGLTIAPASNTRPQVWEITTLIDRMDAPESAKEVAKAAVHAAGLAGGEEG